MRKALLTYENQEDLYQSKTGGKFACACVYPLNDDNVIAGVKTARDIQMLLLVCVCFLRDRSLFIAWRGVGLGGFWANTVKFSRSPL